MSEAMLVQGFVVAFVPLLSICLYQWDTSNKSRLERDQEEVAGLREFVLQPLRSQSLSEGYAPRRWPAWSRRRMTLCSHHRLRLESYKRSLQIMMKHGQLPNFPSQAFVLPDGLYSFLPVSA